MSPYHGCLDVGTGGHLPEYMRPAPCQIRTRLFSYPGWLACCLAQGNLEAFVGGPIRGCLHEDGRHKVETGRGCFAPVSMLQRLFAGVLLVTHCRRPFWLHHKVEAEASTGPQPSTPLLDILGSMLTGNPHHA